VTAPPVFKPHRIVQPLSAEDIDYNFDVIFRALVDTIRTVPVAVNQGGTGKTVWNVGDLLYASAPDIIAGLTAVAAGNVLLSNGLNAAPVYGKVNLQLHVVNVLLEVNGGTGESTYTKGDLLAGDAGAGLTKLTVGTNGQVLKANSATATGLEWGSAAGQNALLDGANHTDTEAHAPVYGDIIFADTLEFESSSSFWLDGLPGGVLTQGLNESESAFWFDGLPSAGFFSAVQWKHLEIGPVGAVLQSDGGRPRWASDLGEITAIAQPSAVVYVGTAFTTLSDATPTTVSFDLEERDTDGFHSPSVNPERLTIPTGKDGRYLVIGQGSFDTTASGRKAAWIYKNGGRVAIQEGNGDDGGLGFSLTVTTTLDLVAGNYITLVLQQNSGGPSNYLGVGRDLTRLELVKLS
jgi:hypothetical protein